MKIAIILPILSVLKMSDMILIFSMQHQSIKKINLNLLIM